MNVLLLGNGFDLHYYLPTKYNNFLHTVEYLENANLYAPITAGNIFSDKRLAKQDAFITKCYEENKDAFDSTTLDFKKICRLTTLASKNMWFKYLLASFNKDVGWIDFEKEIKKVLDSLDGLFDIEQVTMDFQLAPYSATKHILKYFDFFTDKLAQNAYAFKDVFLIEDPVGSGNFSLNIDKIVDVLFTELCELSEMLKIYLSEFVEKVVDGIDTNQLDSWLTKYNAKSVISFNYTDTYEQLFQIDDVVHIHGTNCEQIVLGINPDHHDDIESVNTRFLPFKKYYQRVFWKTDIDYLYTIDQLERNIEANEKIMLTVIGHSLDETDKDIIVELFEYATSINILYYDSVALSKQVHNLINIYGKQGFDVLRRRKSLTFVQISDEIQSGKVLNCVFEQAVLKALKC